MTQPKANEHTSGVKSDAATGRASPARRYAAWAANLLVSGMIVLAGLVFGGQVLRWWRYDQSGLGKRDHVADVLGHGALGDERRARFFQFGHYPGRLRRSVVEGDADRVVARLQELAQASAIANPPAIAEPTAAESRVLEKFDTIEPVLADGDKWAIYAPVGPLPVVVAVRNSAADSSSIKQSGAVDEGAARIVAPGRRVVFWGMGLPRAERGWTLMCLEPGRDLTRRNSDSRSLPLPPGSEPTMSIRAASEAVTAFRGTGSANRWRRHFDRVSAAGDWKKESRWRPTAAGWQVRYQRSDGSWADVQLIEREPGPMSGVITSFDAPVRRNQP